MGGNDLIDDAISAPTAIWRIVKMRTKFLNDFFQVLYLTHRGKDFFSRESSVIPPTKSVDGSYSGYKLKLLTDKNPTDGVGGIIHTLPTRRCNPKEPQFWKIYHWHEGQV
jgi:hypothetical protein